MDLDAPICLCFNVSRRKIIRFIKVEKPRRASQISECFGAGTGCGWCRPILERLNQQHSPLNKSAQEPAPSQSDPDLPDSKLAGPAQPIDQELDSLDPSQYQSARQAYRDQKRTQNQPTEASDGTKPADPQNPIS